MTDHPTLTFGDDGGSAADSAWGWVTSHAWPGWALELVTAQDPVAGVPPSPDDEQLRPWEPAWAREVGPDAAFVEVRKLTCHGDPRVALMSARDLLVIGPRGPGVLKALHLGSTAEWLLEVPPCPLVIARRAQATERVLVCTDGSVHALAAVSAFARLPWAKQAEAFVLAVSDGRADEGGLEPALDVLGGAGVAATALARQGKPTAAILAAVEEQRADLVVLGTRGLTGLRRLRLGSTASAVARAVACSVLLTNVGGEDTGT